MRVFVDTNVLLRYVNPDDPAHPVIVAALDRLLFGGHEIGFTPQVCREFWNVATRPRSANGFGLEPELVNQLVTDISKTLDFWDDEPGIAMEWRKIVVELKVKGVQVHDANHAAAALWHGATHVLTLDQDDFDRYSQFGLIPISPSLLT